MHCCLRYYPCQQKKRIEWRWPCTAMKKGLGPVESLRVESAGDCWLVSALGQLPVALVSLLQNLLCFFSGAADLGFELKFLQHPVLFGRVHNQTLTLPLTRP